MAISSNLGSQVSGNTPVAADNRGIDALRASAARDPKGAIKEAAKQFEALFMQELMKSMRAATLSSGLLDNEGTQLGTDLLDQQYATRLSGLPGGLSDMIARQLERQMGMAPGPIPSRDSANPVPRPLKAANVPAWDEKFNTLLQEIAWEAVQEEPLSGVKSVKK